MLDIREVSRDELATMVPTFNEIPAETRLETIERLEGQISRARSMVASLPTHHRERSVAQETVSRLQETLNETINPADTKPIRLSQPATYVRLANGQTMDQTRYNRTVESLYTMREDIVDDLARLGRTPLGDPRVTDRIRSLQSIATQLRNLGKS